MIGQFGWTALATLLAVGVYFVASLLAGRARARSGLKAPAVVGDAGFERAFRAQQNMLEWMPLFLPALWLFGATIGDRAAGVIGALWAVARLGYTLAYGADAAKRGPWFGAQALLFVVLWVGAVVGVVRGM